MADRAQDPDTGLIFTFFNEIGIINQLARARFERCMPQKLSVPHFTVLNHLVRLGDGKTPLQLAEAFQVPKTSMTHTLAGLQQLGLIDTRANPKDGRGKLVMLTDAGRQFRDDAINSLVPDMLQIAERFDFSKLLPLLPVLQELRAIMDRYRDIG